MKKISWLIPAYLHPDPNVAAKNYREKVAKNILADNINIFDILKADREVSIQLASKLTKWAIDKIFMDLTWYKMAQLAQRESYIIDSEGNKAWSICFCKY